MCAWKFPKPCAPLKLKAENTKETKRHDNIDFISSDILLAIKYATLIDSQSVNHLDLAVVSKKLESPS